MSLPSIREVTITYWTPLFLYKMIDLYIHMSRSEQKKKKLKRNRDFVRYLKPWKGFTKRDTLHIAR